MIRCFHITKRIVRSLSFALLCFRLGADEALIKYSGGGNYTLVERTDLRRYDDGRYTGLVSKEVRSFIRRAASSAALSQRVKGGNYYDGDFYIKQQTVRSNRKMSSDINMSIPASFCITQAGELIMTEDNGYPSFRSFPAFSSSAVNAGDKWRADAVRAVDPLENGAITRMPIHVEYTYIGKDVWQGQEVFSLTAKWATRYGGIHGGGGEFGGYVDRYGDPSLLRAEGSHEATMYVSCSTGAALVVHDKVDETYIYGNGKSVSFKGTISLFTEYPPAVNRDSLIPALQRAGIASAALQKKDGTSSSSAGGKASGVVGAVAGGAAGSVIADESKGGGGADKSIGGITSNGGAGSSGGKTIKDGSSGGVTGGGVASGKGKRKDKDKSKASNNGKAESKDNTKDGGEGEVNREDKGTLRKQSLAEAAAAVASSGAEDDDHGIKVEDTSSGVRFTMQNLRFLPDSAQLLPEEKERVKIIASVLHEVPGAVFLVEGHTASTGKPNGEQILSEERARTIAKALSSYGIDSSRFICKGSGARKPIASNDTPQGKAQNRRVEITILE